ncbi:hypothetical protein ABBQ32_008626 [Trebouxia sp. C0010 RCD-2024]
MYINLGSSPVSFLYASYPYSCCSNQMPFYIESNQPFFLASGTGFECFSYSYNATEAISTAVADYSLQNQPAFQLLPEEGCKECASCDANVYGFPSSSPMFLVGLNKASTPASGTTYANSANCQSTNSMSNIETKLHSSQLDLPNHSSLLKIAIWNQNLIRDA